MGDWTPTGVGADIWTQILWHATDGWLAGWWARYDGWPGALARSHYMMAVARLLRLARISRAFAGLVPWRSVYAAVWEELAGRDEPTWRGAHAPLFRPLPPAVIDAPRLRRQVALMVAAPRAGLTPAGPPPYHQPVSRVLFSYAGDTDYRLVDYSQREEMALFRAAMRSGQLDPYVLVYGLPPPPTSWPRPSPIYTMPEHALCGLQHAFVADYMRKRVRATDCGPETFVDIVVTHAARDGAVLFRLAAILVPRDIPPSAARPWWEEATPRYDYEYARVPVGPPLAASDLRAAVARDMALLAGYQTAHREACALTLPAKDSQRPRE